MNKPLNKTRKPATKPNERRRSRWAALHPLPLPVDVMTRCLRYFRETT